MKKLDDAANAPRSQRMESERGRVAPHVWEAWLGRPCNFPQFFRGQRRRKRLRLTAVPETESRLIGLSRETHRRLFS